MEPTSEAVPPPAPGPPPAGPVPPRRGGRGREVAIVAAFAAATMVVVALLLRFALGSADARRERQGSLVALPTPEGRCAVAADGRILGKVTAVLGRGDRAETYRLEEYPGHGVAPVASTIAVPVDGTKLVRCTDLAPKPVR